MHNIIMSHQCISSNEVANLIVKAAAPGKIYLLARSFSQQHTQGIFALDAQPCSRIGHYYVLVLVSKNTTYDNNALQDKIENNCRAFIPVTAMVVEINEFNGWLIAGHPFANKVYQTAECIYDAGSITFPTPTPVDEEELQKTNGQLRAAGINKVQEFLAGADLFRIREQNKMAAFMLHQAAEHALHTLLKITTGLHVHTHNLDKLIRYCSMVSNHVSAIFPRHNEKDERLFQLLQKAYTAPHRSETYSIPAPALLLLTGRVRALLEIVKNVNK